MQHLELIERELRRVKAKNDSIVTLKHVIELLVEEMKLLTKESFTVRPDYSLDLPQIPTIQENLEKRRRQSIPLPGPPTFKTVNAPDPRNQRGRTGSTAADGLDDLISVVKKEKK